MPSRIGDGNSLVLSYLCFGTFAIGIPQTVILRRYPVTDQALIRFEPFIIGAEPQRLPQGFAACACFGRKGKDIFFRQGMVGGQLCMQRGRGFFRLRDGEIVR